MWLMGPGSWVSNQTVLPLNLAMAGSGRTIDKANLSRTTTYVENGTSTLSGGTAVTNAMFNSTDFKNEEDDENFSATATANNGAGGTADGAEGSACGIGTGARGPPS